MTTRLEWHLSDMQSKALTMETLLGGLDRCLDDPTLHGLSIELVESLSSLAKEIGSGLDSVNLAKLEADQ